MRRRGSRPRLSHDREAPEEAQFNPSGLVLMPALALVKGGKRLGALSQEGLRPTPLASHTKMDNEGEERGRSEASSRTLIGLDVCSVRFPAVHYQTKYTGLEPP